MPHKIKIFQRTCFAVVFAAQVLLSTPVMAAGVDDQPITISANEITYDYEGGIVIASGAVRVEQNRKTLFADRVSYNEKTGEIRSDGPLRLVDENGNVIAADQAELTDTLESGFLKGIRALLGENAKLAAFDAQRINGNTTIFRRAVYSPCDVCADSPTPVWQVKAYRVRHDQAKRKVVYHNALLEFFGVPLLYTPWLSHPDTDVKRASGFLLPVFGSTSRVGNRIEIPYYVAISPSQDVTLRPMLTTGEGPVMSAEYRRRLNSGQLEFSGSGTSDKQRDANGNLTGRNIFRGHVFGDGQFDLTEDKTTRAGFKLQLASDDTYLRRYEFSKLDTLTNNVYVEKFMGRSYAAINGWAFQGLRSEDTPGQTPFIAPMLDWHYVGKPGAFGAVWRFDANAMALGRTQGARTRRVVLAGSWEIPYTSPLGQIYKLTASLRGDLYHNDGIDGVDPTIDPVLAADKGFIGRVVPQAALDWRWPFVRYGETTRQVIEPVVNLVSSVEGGNPRRIPNEDSRSFEFDDTNLFDLNRFPGYDRWESGTRVTAGVRGSFYGERDQASLMVGESFRLTSSNAFPAGSGLEDKASDIVGRLELTIGDYFDYIHRIRVSKDNFSIRRNEIQTSFGPQRFKFNLGFLDIRRDPETVDLINRREVQGGATVQISRYWSIGGDAIRDLLSGENRFVQAGGYVRYNDECLDFRIIVRRDYTFDRDIRPSTAIYFRIALKNFG